MRFDCIIFDFFGVICSEIAPFWLAERFSATEAGEIKKSIVGEADSGRITEVEMFERLGKLVGISGGQVESEWRSYVVVDLGVVETLRTLRRNYRLGMLTNAPSRFVRRILEEHELAVLFDSIVVSSEIGYAKPSAEAYHEILTRLQTDAGAALLVDDNPINVAGGEKVGISGLLFTSPEDLMRQLSAVGVTV